jgi:hypothetical protein
VGEGKAIEAPHPAILPPINRINVCRAEAPKRTTSYFCGAPPSIPGDPTGFPGTANRLNRLLRPAFLLSGLLTCGCCGGKYGIVVNDRYGCLGHFRKGTCDNGRTIRRNDIERRVLAGLTDKLVSSEVVAAAVRAYAEETNRQNHERRAQAETNRRALEKIERSIKGIMEAIEDGMYQPAMKARMTELTQQKAETEARLADAPADLPDVHPSIAEHYRAKVIRLAETLAEPESNGEAREDIRSLVGEVVSMRTLSLRSARPPVQRR